MVLDYTFFIELEELYLTGRLKDYDPRKLYSLDEMTIEELDRTIGG